MLLDLPSTQSIVLSSARFPNLVLPAPITLPQGQYFVILPMKQVQTNTLNSLENGKHFPCLEKVGINQAWLIQGQLTLSVIIFCSSNLSHTYSLIHNCLKPYLNGLTTRNISLRYITRQETSSHLIAKSIIHNLLHSP